MSEQLQELIRRVEQIVPIVMVIISPQNAFPARTFQWMEVHRAKAASSAVQLQDLLEFARSLKL